jgi:stage V sporulation protein G
MELTEIRVKLAGSPEDKLRAYCSITLDNCFVVRDLKIIKGTKGLFVAMPSRKLSDLCPQCRAKNHLRARFCNECGHALVPDRAARDDKGRSKLHADIAHPINADYREELQRRVLEAFEEELSRSQQPGYLPPSDEYLDIGSDADDLFEEPIADSQQTRERPPEREVERPAERKPERPAERPTERRAERPPERPAEPQAEHPSGPPPAPPREDKHKFGEGLL